jgi:hypothetical protein
MTRSAARLARRGLLALLAAATPLAAQSGKPADPDRPVAGGNTVAPGWSARPDGGASLADVKVVPMKGGLHVTLGPAVILYRGTDRAGGPFHTLATFTQTKRPTHPEGYGLFFGGQALGAASQQYTYFLVRGDGRFLVKRRNGEKAVELTKGWTAHPAVRKADANGRATNLLEIDNKRNPERIAFLVNGQEVYAADPRDLRRDGGVGLRVNHNLDVQITGFDLHQ